MKIFLLTFLLLLFTVIGNAEEVKEKQKTYDELMAEFLKGSEELEEAKAKTLAEKRETESAIKVNQKLDELLGVLSKDK